LCAAFALEFLHASKGNLSKRISCNEPIKIGWRGLYRGFVPDVMSARFIEKGVKVMIIRSVEKGQALIIIALAAAVLFAFSALAIDGSMVFSDRRYAQNATDTAVLAAVLVKIRLLS